MNASLTSVDSSQASNPAPQAAPKTKVSWAGRILSGIPVVFLFWDGLMKLGPASFVVDAMNRLGFPPDSARPIGVVLLLCVITYVIPRSAILGAVLLTGYLGGAVATHVHGGDSLFGHILFPVYVGIMIWGGLYLRDPRVRAIVPWREGR